MWAGPPAVFLPCFSYSCALFHIWLWVMDLREQLGERLAEFDEVLEALRSAEGRMGELVAELRGAGVQREVLARRMEERLGLKRDTARRRLMVLEERLGVSGGPK